MRLILLRTLFTSQSTEGELSFDNEIVAAMHTLELPNRDGLPGSCIPQGEYPVVLAPSHKFQLSEDPWIMQYAGTMPHLVRIPNRTNILIHWGNDPADTEGCILVGMEAGDNFVGSSRLAFQLLHAKLSQSTDNTIKIVGGAVSNGNPATLDASDND